MAVVTEQFAGNSLFQKALKEAFVEFTNRDIGKHTNADLMSSFCDRILKTGGEKLSDEDVEAFLEKTVQLFSCVTVRVGEGLPRAAAVRSVELCVARAAQGSLMAFPQPPALVLLGVGVVSPPAECEGDKTRRHPPSDGESEPAARAVRLWLAHLLLAPPRTTPPEKTHRYLTDKDLFAEIYRNQLAKRLLNQRSASDDAERLMIGKLKLRCGSQFTGKMEGMLNDLAIGVDHQSDFDTHTKEHKSNLGKVEFSVQVLTTGYWPTYQVEQPPERVCDGGGRRRPRRGDVAARGRRSVDGCGGRARAFGAGRALSNRREPLPPPLRRRSHSHRPACPVRPRPLCPLRRSSTCTCRPTWCGARRSSRTTTTRRTRSGG